MKKVLLIIAAAALIVGAAFTGSAIARERGDRADRAAMTTNKIVAHTARIKADLRLTPEQEKNWPGLESALRTLARTALIVWSPSEPNARSRGIRRCHRVSEKQREQSRCRSWPMPRAALGSLDEQQKRRFANDFDPPEPRARH